MNQAVQVDKCFLEKEMHYKNTLLLHYKISYPKFCSRAFEAAVCKMNLFYRGKAVAFQQYCEEKLYCMAVKEYEYSVANGFPVREFEAQVDFAVTYNQDCFVSLFFDEYQFTGGAHGNTVRTSQTWNLQTGCRIWLRQLFPCGFDYRTFLIEEVNRQIAESITKGENYYFENYEALVAQTFQPCSFSLTPDGIAIYFQQYDIAPYSSGIPVFIIPYAKRGATQPECKC